MFSFTEDVRETVAYRGFKEEGREEGRKEGREEARREGLEEGRLLGALEILEALLTQGLLPEREYRDRSRPIRAKLEAMSKPVADHGVS